MEWLPYLRAAISLVVMASTFISLNGNALTGPRSYFAMARDGMVPKSFFGDVHPKFRTPWKSTILIGIFVATMTGFLPIDALLSLTNIGTLLAFLIVCSAVLIMRRTHPEAERPFRAPLVPLTPILGIIMCLLLMFSLPAANWWRLGVWLVIGFLIYFGYSRNHSVMRSYTGDRSSGA
jgi:APA family basic amino acid/polyamine antiporter